MLLWKNRPWDHRKIINLFNWTFIHHTVHLMIFLCLMFKIILLSILFKVKIIKVSNRLTFISNFFRNFWVIERILLWFFHRLLTLGSEHIVRSLLWCLIVIKRDNFVWLSCWLSFWLFGAIYWAVADVMELRFVLYWLMDKGFVLINVRFNLFILLDMLLLLFV